MVEKAVQLKITGIFVVITLVALFAACAGPGENRPGSVEVDPQSETASVSGTGTGTGGGTGAGAATSTGAGAGTGTSTGTVSGSGTSTGVGPGEVKPKPPEAAQVNVSLAEWSVTPDPTTVSAGAVYFLADNMGPTDPHELVIIRTGLPPDQLPVVDGKVPEDQVDLVGEIKEFAPGTQAADTFELTPGNYVLICNLAEMEGGQLESHYQLGMRAQLVVE